MSLLGHSESAPCVSADARSKPSRASSSTLTGCDRVRKGRGNVFGSTLSVLFLPIDENAPWAQTFGRQYHGCSGRKMSLCAEENRLVSLAFHRGAFHKTVFREFTHLDSVISVSPSEVAMSVKQIAGPLRETRAGTSRKVQNRNRSKSPNTPELFFSSQGCAGAHGPTP